MTFFSFVCAINRITTLLYRPTLEGQMMEGFIVTLDTKAEKEPNDALSSVPDSLQILLLEVFVPM